MFYWESTVILLLTYITDLIGLDWLIANFVLDTFKLTFNVSDYAKDVPFATWNIKGIVSSRSLMSSCVTLTNFIWPPLCKRSPLPRTILVHSKHFLSCISKNENGGNGLKLEKELNFLSLDTSLCTSQFQNRPSPSSPGNPRAFDLR